MLWYYYSPLNSIETVPLAKGADETQSEEEPSKSDVSPFWLPFLYMLIEKQP